jgi:tetratricopeptide (TPR) repeat protein
MKAKAIIIILLLSICLTLNFHLRDLHPVNPDEQTASETPMQLLILGLGEFRYTLASMVWIKIDCYWHEFEFNTITNEQNTSIVPMLRLVTLLDPHFQQAYEIGGYFLSHDLGLTREAIDFLEEGVRNNPESFQINFDLGMLYFTGKQYKEAIPHILKSYKLTREKQEKINALRVLTYCYDSVHESSLAVFYAQAWTKIDPYAHWAKKILHKYRVKPNGNPGKIPLL